MLISVNRLHLMNLAESCSPVGNGRWYHFRECGFNGAYKKVLDDLKLIKCLLNTIGYIGHYAQYSGEGDGTPLQYSCLENPMDGGAWWADYPSFTVSIDLIDIPSSSYKNIEQPWPP